MTLREVGAVCGINHQTVANIENGENTTLDTLDLLLGVFGLELCLGPPARATDVGDREAIAQRYLRVLPGIPDEEIEVHLAELALWEHRYGGRSK